jgi:shikimate dehydrogenase
MDAATTLVGVVGDPVRHSLSPAFWNAALRHVGRNAVFLAFEVRSDAFAAFIEGMRAGGARGFNVTIPHKTAAFEVCTKRSVEAEATRAVNVLVLDGRETRGTNSDVYGIDRALADLGFAPAGSRALVMGAGGAGRAAVFALERAGADVAVTNRTSERAAALGVSVVEWDGVAAAVRDFDLVVHTTSVGLDGAASVLDEPALRAAAAGRLRAVLDVVYRPEETPLVRAARSAGLRAADGLRMLVHQATEAWRLFFGDEAPADVMHSAAAEAAGRS